MNLQEIFWLTVLTSYAIGVTLLTKITFKLMRNKGISKNVAVYYDRKIIHMFAGGIVALSVPFVFSSPWYPLIAGLTLTTFTYIPHHRGKILQWFQTEDNSYDVNFCFMWTVAMFFMWMFFDDPWIAVIPIAFMAFGDGITGVVRNLLFKKRTKHYIGNIFMLMLCIPLGYLIAGLVGIPWAGVLAAVTATIAERYEFGIIDDNILITVSSSTVLFLYVYLL